MNASLGVANMTAAATARFRRWLRRLPRCRAVSPDGERCKYKRGHDSTGEPHSWTRFGFGGPWTLDLVDALGFVDELLAAADSDGSTAEPAHVAASDPGIGGSGATGATTAAGANHEDAAPGLKTDASPGSLGAAVPAGTGLEEALRFWVERADRFEKHLPADRGYMKARGVLHPSYAVGRAAVPVETPPPPRCSTCDDRGEVAATPGQPGDGPMPCPACEPPLFAQSDEEPATCACGADAGDINFDRSLCACGAMHDYCNQCGRAWDCPLDHAAAATEDEVAAITEQLVSGGYDGTEGEEGSHDTTWTDFGIVCGTAERLAARVASLERERDEARELHADALEMLAAAESKRDKWRVSYHAAQRAVASQREALRPFAEFANGNVDEHGWSHVPRGCQDERIVDWFGPSDFRAAADAAHPERSEGAPTSPLAGGGSTP